MTEEKPVIALPDARVERSGRAPGGVAIVDEQSTTLLQVISRAARDPSLDLERMERLLAMQERYQAKQAEQQFAAALAEFKARPLAIAKNRHVSFQTSKGTTEYDHATLDEVCRSVNPGLSEVGITYRWQTEQLEGGRIRVTCLLTHAAGHSERTALMASPDDSGGKNNIQAIGSAVSYLQRYTLLAALGVATGGADNDGASEPELLNEEQIANLEALISEVGANKIAFFTYMKVTSLKEIQAAAYHDAVVALEAKRNSPRRRTP